MCEVKEAARALQTSSIDECHGFRPAFSTLDGNKWRITPTSRQTVGHYDELVCRCL